MTTKMTPLMQQYWDIKSQHMDKILLFRMGDFFEMFHEDAATAAPILNIALTFRNKKAADETKMCGMPHHSVAGPIAKLLSAGHKVAICDQIEDPKEAKGLVKRAVTRILSPGMVFDPDTLDQLQANYLASFDESTVSFLETTTGEAFYYSVSDMAERQKLITLLSPAELVLSNKQKQEIFRSQGGSHQHVTAFDPEILEKSDLPTSAQRLLAYARYMQGEEILKALLPFERRSLNQHMELSPTVLRHLEIFSTYKGDSKGSLFYAINRTKTSAGARMLRSWLSFPLAAQPAIERRLEQVQFWTQRHNVLEQVRELLSRMGDIERRVAKVSQPNCNARDLLALTQSLRVGLELSQYVQDERMESLALDEALGLVQDMETTLSEDPPISVHEGGMIRTGVSTELDELIDLSQNAQKRLVELENREKEKTGISSLKVRYNNVFGYYIEITKTHQAKAPAHYMRKQTLANAERFTTEELNVLEEKVLSANSKRAKVEYEVFASLRQKVLDRATELLHLAKVWSELDVIAAFAWLAIENNYKRPSFSTDRSLELSNSRHPVVEQEVGLPFVPNSLKMSASECLMLTGPNMAGKSTLMRQVVTTVIMAQAGSFVPAENACLPIFEKIFTRIGASDFLNEGLSTFMVEMKETAEILSAASENSLVVLDEVGRGTSTYDGMSLAQSILEFLLNKKKPMTLFATHYHELTRMSLQFPQIQNAHMAISEKGGEIQFLHTLQQGPANKSYGIHVGKLAGLPAAVTQRAKVLLDKLEAFQSPASTQMTLLDVETEPLNQEVNPEIQELVEKIKNLQLQKLTPLDALNQIAQWQQNLS